MQVSNTQRVNSVLDWLRRPADIRPEFVTLYFDTVDSAGHGGGPEGEVIEDALRDIDAHVAALVAGLERLGQPANLVLVSDHGMAPTGSDKMIVLDEIVDASLYRAVEAGAYASFEATEGNVEAFEAAILREHDHMECWRKEDIPARFQYGTHRRIPPYFCLPDTGWTITNRASDSEWSEEAIAGYDPYAPEMASLFIAHGPPFAAERTIDSFQNTAITPAAAASDRPATGTAGRWFARRGRRGARAAKVERRRNEHAHPRWLCNSTGRQSWSTSRKSSARWCASAISAARSSIRSSA